MYPLVVMSHISNSTEMRTSYLQLEEYGKVTLSPHSTRLPVIHSPSNLVFGPCK